jgi:lysophospholipase L1-like esterase
VATTIAITGQYYKADAVTPASGYVTFTLSQELRDTSTNEVYSQERHRVRLSVGGALSTTLVSTDDPDLTPQGAFYEVIEEIDGDVTRYFIEVPYDSAGGTLDISDAVLANGQGVTYGVTQSDLTTHEADTTSVHGLFNTTQIVGASEDMPGPLYLYLIGDSHSADEDFRRPFLDQLRRTGDVVMLGPELIENSAVTDSWAPNYRSKFDLPDPRHGAFSGRTVAQVTSNLNSTALTDAEAIAMICPGTNDVAAGTSSSTILTSIGTLLTTIQASSSAPIFIAQAPPYVEEHPGQTDSQHTTRQTVQAAVHSGMAALVAGYTNVTYLDVSYNDGDSEIDGIHLREQGRMRVAKVLADEINRRFPEREGVLWPQTFRYRENDAFSSGFATAANYWETTSDAFRPAPGERFVWGFDVKITDLQAAGVSTIMSYGPYASSDHCMIGHSNTGDLRVYVASGGPTLTVQPPTLLNNWRRVVLWGDPTNGLLAIFVDGQIRGYLRDATAWTIGSGKAARLGDNAHASITGMVGYMNHAFTGHGSTVPEWPEIRRQVEAWYWYGIPIAGQLLHFELDESSYGAGVYPNNGLSTTPMTTASTPTVTAYATAGAKPWDEESA